jgi:murein DD-endopeptidase MepM/ murein hydrolase activator NlpD
MRPPRPTIVAFAALAAFLVSAGAGASSYTLRWGDTLSSVAKRYGVPVKAITAANDIADADHIREGKQLTIPDKAAAQVAAAKPILAVKTPGGAAAAATGARLHKVVKGETLGMIAKKYVVSVDELRKLNGITNDRKVRDGRDLQLPLSAKVDATPGDASKPAPVCPVLGAGKFDFSNSFGQPREGHRRHNGNDIFAKRGTPVVAPMGGTLRRADGSVAGLAWYIDGDDGVTYYGAHLDAISAQAGRVEQGQRLGVVGNSGNASTTPTHLHFEVHPGNGVAVDPYGYLRAWCKATR